MRMMRSLFLVSAFILFSSLILCAHAADLSIGFALPQPADEYYAISQQVLNGIRFWANETKDWQLGANAGTRGPKYSNFPIVVEQTGAAESIGAAYVRLAQRVDVLVGPVGTAALADVAASLRAANIQKIMSVPNGDAIYYSGRVQPSVNYTLPAFSANSTYPSMLSLLPPYSIFLEEPTLNLTLFKRLLEKKKIYQYAILSVAADPNSEIDTFAFNAAFALQADLKKDPARVVSYSVELYGSYSTQAELDFFMTTFANLRPQPEVLVLFVPTYNRTRVQQVITAMATAKVDPDAIIWMFPIDNPEKIEPKSDRRQFKYQTALSFWGDTLDIESSSYLGSARTFSEHYESRYSKKVLAEKPTRQAGTWEAVGAAHAQLIELWLQSLTPTEFNSSSLPAPNRVLYTKRRDTFFNRVQFDPNTGRNVAFRLAAFQYYMGNTRSVDEEIGEQDDISRPGRWSWKKYSLAGAAISAIIIGSILAVGGLAVAIWSTWHFVDIFLNPPKESDEENEDDDD